MPHRRTLAMTTPRRTERSFRRWSGAWAALLPVVLAVGCSATSLAERGDTRATIELVSMHRRESLFGGRQSTRSAPRPVVRNDYQQPRQVYPRAPQSQPVPQPVPANANSASPERMLAIARLFMVQGRTQEAHAIYRQLGRAPEPFPGASPPAASSAAATANQTAAKPGQIVAGAPNGPTAPSAQTAVTAPPASQAAASVPAPQPSNATVSAATKNTRQPSAAAPAANGPNDRTAPQSTQVVSAAQSSTASTPANSNVVSTSHQTAPASAASSAPVHHESRGWRATSKSRAAHSDDQASVASAAEKKAAKYWSAPTTESHAAESPAPEPTASVASRSGDEPLFELPANSPRPKRWNAAVNIHPGKFASPTVQDDTAQDDDDVVAQEETRGASPAEAPAEQGIAAGELPADEADDDAPGLMIIPNGTGAAEKLASVRKAIRREIAAVHPAPPSAGTLLTATALKEIHTPKVLELAQQLADADPKQRALAAQELGMAGAEARTALPVLRGRLTTEKDKLARVRMVEAIVRIVPDDPQAIALLCEMLQDKDDWRVRQLAAAALEATARGNDAAVVEKLAAAMNDWHPRVRAMVALTLGSFGPKAKAALPRLQFATTTDIPRVREAAQAAIDCISPGTPAEGAAAEGAPESIEPNELAERPGLLEPNELNEQPNELAEQPSDLAGPRELAEPIELARPALLPGIEADALELKRASQLRPVAKRASGDDEDDKGLYSGTLLDFDVPADKAIQSLTD